MLINKYIARICICAFTRVYEWSCVKTQTKTTYMNSTHTNYVIGITVVIIIETMNRIYLKNITTVYNIILWYALI